jgi:hypothetical protein
MTQPLKRELTSGARRHAQRHLGRLDQEGATAAHRIEQRHAGLPATQAQYPGGQIFLQRRETPPATTAAPTRARDPPRHPAPALACKSR